MNTSSSVACPAFALGQGALIVYLAFLSAFVPLSTDLYLPALPSMGAYFQASPELTNLTLIGFMFLYALSMLVWGPLSDKYGRKPILLVGILLYLAASVASALSLTIWQLIAGRCFQALGSGAVSAVAMAVVKDAFRGRIMESVLTWVQTMTMLAPMLAPVIGGALLTFTSWRGVFWVLTACGILALLGSFALRETLTEPTQGSALRSLSRVPFVLRNKGFSSLLLVFSLAVMPFMAYLATSAYIFQGTFRVSAQAYSYFFAATAAFSILGPLAYGRFLRNLPRSVFLSAGFLLTALCGVLLLTCGDSGPYVFTLCYIPVSFFASAVRPPSTMLLMNQLDTDTGTVASLIGSATLLFGSLAMLLCSSLPPVLGISFIAGAGWLCLAVGIVCCAGWLCLDKARQCSHEIV